jgi:hypothetical protein
MVRFYLLRCVIGVVGAAIRLINLPQLYSHIGDDLLGGMETMLIGPSDRQMVLSSFFHSSEISFSVCRSHSLLFATT